MKKRGFPAQLITLVSKQHIDIQTYVHIYKVYVRAHVSFKHLHNIHIHYDINYSE